MKIKQILVSVSEEGSSRSGEREGKNGPIIRIDVKPKLANA